MAPHTLRPHTLAVTLPLARQAAKPLLALMLPLLLWALADQGQAQTQKLAAGLWENSTKMNISSAAGGTQEAMARMQKEMAAMPPEQRKMVQDMMAKQGVGMGAQPNSVRVCVSAEQAEKGTLPQDGRCTQESLQRSGNTLRMKFSCQGPPPSSGEGEYTFSSDKAYSGRMKVNTSVKGQPASMDMEVSGRWISADCGTLKPRP